MRVNKYIFKCEYVCVCVCMYECVCVHAHVRAHLIMAKRAQL